MASILSKYRLTKGQARRLEHLRREMSLPAAIKEIELSVYPYSLLRRPTRPRSAILDPDTCRSCKAFFPNLSKYGSLCWECRS